MKTSHLLLLIGALSVLIGAYLKITQSDYGTELLAFGLIVEFIGILLQIKSQKTPKS